MIDPITALSVASTAVGQMRQLINAGRDTTQAMSKFAGAWADINEAERQAKTRLGTRRLAARWKNVLLTPLPPRRKRKP